MMQIKYLLSRASSGYVFIIPVLIVFFLLLSVFCKKQKPLHIVTTFVFCFYLFLIIAATGIGNTVVSSFSPEIIWVPFRDMFVAPKHFALNITAFIPFGIFLPLLYKKFCNIKLVVLAGFLFSLCIELVQMFGWGVTEIDDLMANTLGVCLGYCAYCVTKKCLRKDFDEQFQAVNINDTFELFSLSVCIFLIMALVEPITDCFL